MSAAPRRAIVGNRCSGDERPNAIYSGRALCGDSERPNGCRATKKYDKFPSPHGFARAEDYIGYQKQYHILGREACRSARTARPHVRFGSKSDIGACPRHVCFTPKSGHCGAASRCPLCAKSRLMQCSKKDRYSITWSARTSRVSGIFNPSAFAVLRLITSSNLVGRSMGSSLGFVPERMRAT